MSWYLFNSSPERQYRGKKVDGYQNNQKTKVNLDWGLGELSPKKPSNIISKTIQKPTRSSKSQHLSTNIQTNNIQKSKIIQQAVKILTQSSDQQGKQQLMRVLKRYDKKNQKQDNYYTKQTYAQQPVMQSSKNYSNKSMNVLNAFEFDSEKTTNNSKSKPLIDQQTAKRMRFLQNSLLPDNKRDNMSAVLDFELNEKVADSIMSDSRLSGKSHFGNKKNQSALQLGDGFNTFVPMRQKIKDMNQKLKEMYDYDDWCRKRQKSQLKLG